MKLSIKLFIILALMGINIGVFSQSELEEAKKLNSDLQYKKALQILESYFNSHKDLNTFWLYAETLHKAKKYKKSQEIYRDAISKFQENRILKLDYAIKLAESGNLEAAEQNLVSFLNTKDDYEFVALKNLAKVYLWQGKYDSANESISEALAISKNDTEAKQLYENISLARKHILDLDLVYNIDDQPLSSFNTKANFAYYLNDFATVGAKFRTPFFAANSYNIGFSVFNTLSFHKLKAKSYVELGFDKLPNNKIAFNGALLLSKHIYKHLSIELNTSYKPYLLTSSAINMNLMELKYGLDFVWNNANGFLGKAGFNINQFPSYKNFYYTGSAWLMSPKLKVSVFDFRLGYGFGYSNSKESTYEAKDPLSTIIADETLTTIEGYYNPYFTPSKQMVNSAIVSINAKPINFLNINLTGSFGFYSYAYNPYLTLASKNGNGNQGNQIYIKTLYSKEIYFPLDIGAKISYNITSNFNTGIYYKYLSTKYYNSHTVGLKAKYLF